MGWFRLGTSHSRRGPSAGGPVSRRPRLPGPLSPCRPGRHHPHRLPGGANWKAIVENYNECYHCGPVHPELVPAFKQRGGAELGWGEGIPHREGAWTFTCDFLFHRDEAARPGFDPGDAVGFWDLVNRQDRKACELVQQGMASPRFTTGFYAPMGTTRWTFAPTWRG